ncbi:P-loop containing nucleoside triphosphate hydrolase protein [Mycena filopes]|nr:P-loop containing nucleoside triphosphate hydrolase protein [Mycena filopes]
MPQATMASYSFVHPTPRGDYSTNQDSSWMSSFMGLSSMFGLLGLVSQSHLGSSLKLLILGTLIETGRRFCRWVIERFRIQYSLTAQFNEGDPAYEWIILFLTEERIWKRSREFIVTAKNSQRKWAVQTSTDPKVSGSAEYVPTYKAAQLFRWRGYWLEIKRGNNGGGASPMHMNNNGQQSSRLFVTIYTLDMNVLSELVEAARLRYVEVNRPHVTIHLTDTARLPSIQISIILPKGLLDSLVQDAEEFLNSENWYVGAGIPHRRGYLLHGPPGTGKTSTIYALAGALNLEIYSLSLASSLVDDNIDCAFPSRADEEEDVNLLLDNTVQPRQMRARPARAVTPEGKLFFATTGRRAPPPGRIDRKIEYALSTTEQTRALFLRFFPPERFHHLDANTSEKEQDTDESLDDLAARFAAGVPAQEFSTAELQGYLQGYKTRPVEAVRNVGGWVEEERREREAREVREEERRAKLAMSRAQAFSGGGGLGARRDRADGGLGRGEKGTAAMNGVVPTVSPTS